MLQGRTPQYFRVSGFVLISIFLCSIVPGLAQAIVLDILNPPNGSGDIVVSKGTSVEVDFDVSSITSNKNDELQLIRVDDNSIVSKKKRGNSPTGTVNLHTNASNAIGALRIDYVQGGAAVGSSAAPVLVVADEGSVVLSEQISALQVVDDIQGGLIGDNTTAINTNAANITNLDSRLTTAEGNIATNTTDISILTGLVSNNGADIDILEGNVTTLQGDVLSLQTTVGGLPTTFLTGNTGPSNTALGTGANPSDTGSRNTTIGRDALTTNTTGNDNTALGENALRFNQSGNRNVAIGGTALEDVISGSQNVAVGNGALRESGASWNTAVGHQAMLFHGSGTENTAVGALALEKNTTGQENTGVGFQALANTTGNSNIGIGHNSGILATLGSNNIMIGSQGQIPDSDTIRIGQSQTQTFIAGIRSIATGQSNAINVVIDSNGQLGTVSSSRRYKEDIRNLGNLSDRLFQLRPVSFKYKQAQPDGAKPLQYGLVAEEVAQVFPDLVVYDKEGRVETVQYRKLTPLLLNELQKEHRVNLTQAEKIQAQEEKILTQAKELAEVRSQLQVVETQYQQLQELQARLAKLEAEANAVPVSLH